MRFWTNDSPTMIQRLGDRSAWTPGDEKGAVMDDDKICARLVEGSKQEPYARLLGMEVKEVRKGYALAEMRFVPDIENIFGMAHGGAIYSLLDEAFQTAANSHGSLAVALNMSVTYVNAPEPGALLRAEAREVS